MSAAFGVSGVRGTVRMSRQILRPTTARSIVITAQSIVTPATTVKPGIKAPYLSRPSITRRHYSSTASLNSTMKALVYKSSGELSLEERPRPEIIEPTDVILRMTKTTICGTDLHIKKGHVDTVGLGRILGHEGIGVIEQTGASVRGFKTGERVLISCISSCGTCRFCRDGMYSHCTSGGWLLGNTVDGTQAEYVRIPHADSSLFPVLAGVDEGAMVMLSDALPTGHECGVVNGKVRPGSTVAVVGVGPVGLSSLITAGLYSPSVVLAIDNDENRLATAKDFGATHVCTSKDAIEMSKSLTPDGDGFDTVIEAVGIAPTFELAQKLIAPGGTLANMGVHGTKVDLFLQDLWSRNIAITTRLVDTITLPMLLRLVESGKLNPQKLITHNFKFKDIGKAYETFGAAAEHKCMKILIDFE